MAYSTGQTAVIIPVTAAEAAVSRFRLRYDSSAPFGVPAHLTIVFPFVPVDRLTAVDLLDLAGIFAAEPAFDLTFTEFGRFSGRRGDHDKPVPDVLWLAPEPADPFRRLTVAVANRWPDAPPYSGLFDDIVPHLTVTETAPADTIDQAQTAISAALPIATRIESGSLIVFDGMVWRERQQLPLSGPTAAR